MKRIIQILALVSALFISAPMMAQTGNTGGVLDVEITQKCYDGTTNFITVYIFRIGDSVPTLLNHFDTEGVAYTVVDSSKVTYGYCQSAGPGTTLDTLYDYEMVPMCDVATTPDTSYYTLNLSKTIVSTGSVTVSKVGDYTTDGASYTPGASPVAGFCSASPPVIDTLYDYEIINKCDTANGVGYITIILKKTTLSSGSVAVSKVGDYDANGGVYVPGASPLAGFCFQATSRVERNVNELITSTVGTITVPNKTLTDVVITNTGFTVGTYTLVGEPAADLLPGETWYCHAIWDPTNYIWNVCPDLSWDATGTFFHITIRSVPE